MDVLERHTAVVESVLTDIQVGNSQMGSIVSIAVE
jgi:hypothetical protein